MDDHDAVNNDGDPQSHSPTPSPPHPPPPAAGPTQMPTPPASTAVTVAASPHLRSLTLALPIQTPSPASAASNGGGNGREDCWSEGATSTLIDAWGERYLELERGSLKQKQWQEVADAVSARDDYTKPPKTDAQCKNRIDTLKKKYKSEKSKIASGQSRSSAWPYFHRLNILIGPNFIKPPAARSSKPRRTPPAFPPQFPQKTRTQTVLNSTAVGDVVVKKRSKSPASVELEEEKESSPEGEGESNGWRELSKAMERLGDVYERVERAKTQHTVEMEKQRMGFVRELELQRMQFFVKTQMELSSSFLRPSHKRRSKGGDDDQRHTHLNTDNRNVDGNKQQ